MGGYTAHEKVVDDALNAYLSTLTTDLPTEEQKDAIREILCGRVCVLQGKGGS